MFEYRLKNKWPYQFMRDKTVINLFQMRNNFIIYFMFYNHAFRVDSCHRARKSSGYRYLQIVNIESNKLYHSWGWIICQKFSYLTIALISDHLTLFLPLKRLFKNRANFLNLQRITSIQAVGLYSDRVRWAEHAFVNRESETPSRVCLKHLYAFFIEFQ